MNTAWRHSFPLPSLFEAPLKIGELRFKALCPAHLETHASCVVNYHRKHGWRWHCFACNADGDALDVLTLRGMAVREALGMLDSAGREVDQRNPASWGNPVGRQYAGGPPCAFVAICDSCRSEHATFEPREYGNGNSRPHYTFDALEEATASGWEIAAGINACVGPKCLERIA